MYREISMSQRLDRIGELLAKGVYLYAKNEKLRANPRLKNRVKIKAKMPIDRCST